MEVKRADFTKCIYLVSGSNLAFESKDMVSKYIEKKWGVRDEQIKSFATHAGDFESGADVQTLNINGREVKILSRRVVTEENLNAAIEQGW